MGMGGADKLLMTAAQAMQSHGHSVRIVSLTALGPMGLEAQSLGIPTESLNMPRGLPDPRALIRLIRLVHSWKPDVVHSHMVHANLMARVLRLFVRVPALVSTIHNINEGGRARMLAYRLSNGLVDHMTIVSEAAADRFVSEGIVPRRLLTVIPNGVDVELFRNVSSSARDTIRESVGASQLFIWLAVGRFEVAKDYPNMLQAFAMVCEREPQAVLLLVGRGSLQRETETLVRALGLGDSVRFLGVRHDIPEVMSAADAYVMSSAWEGMPMVLLEAAAASLPIVATRVGGNHEVVQEGETGFLVPPGHAEALAEKMIRMMKLSSDQRRAMGALAREHVRTEYGLVRVAEQWESLYSQVLTRKGFVLAPQLTS
jgi:glycosyltransferase involved in cell wall biosynthesis